MGQRNANALPQKQPGGTWDTFIECEVNHDTHEVHPTVWPPVPVNNGDANPSMALPCVRCGCMNIVYRGHATGELKGVSVVLPQELSKK